MRGLYINCDTSQIPACAELSDIYSKSYSFSNELLTGLVIYNPHDWSSPPVYTLNTDTFIVSGWFIYEGKRNNLAKLAEDIINKGTQVLNRIELGSFIICWKTAEQWQIISDPMGLSNHFIDTVNDTVTIAPTVKVLYRIGIHTLNPLMESVLAKKGCLFGDFTLFNGIERLTPGSIYCKNGKSHYSDLFSESPLPLKDVGDVFSKATECWPIENRLLPISSGLDSRFILANGQFTYGFTYGPKESSEISIAGQFSEKFEEYHSYDFASPPLYAAEAQLLDEMSFGSVKAIPRLLTNYMYIRNKYKAAHTFFDGYLGDGLQRGTYVNFKGVQGELLKIFPFVVGWFDMSATKLLSLRYKELNEAELEVLYQDFYDKTASFQLDEYQKVVYYESLFGRGGRYTIFCSNVVCGQFFTVVSLFSHKKAFNTFIRQNFIETIKYKTMKNLWIKVPSEYREKKVESGYKPSTSPLFIPFIQIAYRLMLHCIPSRANYDINSKRINKKS